MTLDANHLVELPEKGLVIRRTGKHQTVYKVLKTFRNEKGQPTNTRVTIGRIDQTTGKLIPNNQFFIHYGGIDFGPDYCHVRAFGASFLVGAIIDRLGVRRVLDETFGPARAQLIRTAAIFMMSRGNVFEEVLEFCEGFTLNVPPLSSQRASELFGAITTEERMSFFKGWIARQARESFMAYDVTSFSTYAKGVTDAEWGYNRDGDRLPQINMACYLSEATGYPEFYVTYPGSITDKSHLPYMMSYNDELGVKDVAFVLDRGFCSTVNVQYLVKEGWKYVMAVEARHKTARMAIDDVRERMVSLRNVTEQGVYAMPVHGCFYGVKATMHVFHDAELAERQRRDLRRAIESTEEKLVQEIKLTNSQVKRYRSFFTINLRADGSFSYERDYDKIDDAAKNAGFFCVLTNIHLSCSRTLEIYRRKDMIEKCFDDLKNHIDMKRFRTHNTTTTDGKLFCAFIALIAAAEIESKLGGWLRKKSWSRTKLIVEMEKIRARQSHGGYRLENPLTKTQKEILGHFGMTEADVIKFVKEA